MKDRSHDGASKRTGQDFSIGAFGFITSLITALILWWVEVRFGFALYSWMFWFVVPAGAVCSGFVAASGYLIGARVFNHRPTPLLALNVLLASLGTFITIYYLSYISLEIDGKAVSDYVPFKQYLDIAIRSTSLAVRFHMREVGETGELGDWGYGLAALQIVGFAVGGLAVYGYLSDLPYCQKCSLYLSKKGKQIRYSGDATVMQNSTVQLVNDLSLGVVATAVDGHKTIGNVDSQKGDYLRSTIEVQYCKKCNQHWVKYSVEKQKGNDWKEISKLTVTRFTDQVVDV